MPDLLKLREALEASWDEKTAYLAVKRDGNPALGQCYPTTWLIQQYFPETEIAKGTVWNGHEKETHFWNILESNGIQYHIDLTWQQFPPGSYVKEFKILDRNKLGDGPETIKRCALLRTRVEKYMKKAH
jgi:hypothetical protein